MFNTAARSGRYTVWPGEGTLIFIRPGEDDDGYYQCAAVNSVGKALTVKTNLRRAGKMVEWVCTFPLDLLLLTIFEIFVKFATDIPIHMITFASSIMSNFFHLSFLCWEVKIELRVKSNLYFRFNVAPWCNYIILISHWFSVRTDANMQHYLLFHRYTREAVVHLIIPEPLPVNLERGSTQLYVHSLFRVQGFSAEGHHGCPDSSWQIYNPSLLQTKQLSRAWGVLAVWWGRCHQ